MFLSVRSVIRVTIFVPLICAGLFLNANAAGAYTSEFVGELPDIKPVYLKLFVEMVKVAAPDQLKNLLNNRLTLKEKAALYNFLGKSGLEKAKAACVNKESLDHLINFEKEMSAQSADADLKAALPMILAKSIQIQNLKQLESTYSSLTEAEMGTVSFYLDVEGMGEMFGKIPCEKSEIIMNNTPDWLFIEMGKKSLARFNTYESILYKQERLGKKLQGVETLRMKYRQDPLSVYANWLDGPWKGRELLYNDLISTTHIRVRESGLLGVIPVNVPLTSPLASRGSNHIPTELGIFYLLGMIEKDYRKAAPVGELTRKNLGIQEVDGHKVFVMDSILSKDKSKGYYCYRMRHYIDYERSLEIKAEIFNWNDELAESYTYTKIRIDAPYTEADFQPDNPEYNL